MKLKAMNFLSELKPDSAEMFDLLGCIVISMMI